LLLLITIASLYVGVLLYPLTLDRPLLARVLDWFVAISVGTLVVALLLPEVWADLGSVGLLVSLIAFGVPTIFERWSHGGGAGHRLAIFLVLGGLVLHALLDGGALILSGERSSLAWAVMLHRLPIGLVIGCMLYRPGRLAPAMSAVTLMAIATVLGFVVGDALLTQISDSAHVYFEAVVAGTLLHVVVAHPHSHRHGSEDHPHVGHVH
jgi:hypothetical protein